METGDVDKVLARMHLDLAQAIFDRRSELGFTVNDVAERTGLTPERLEMVEEGDTTSVSDMARLADVLGLEFHLTGLRFSYNTASLVRWVTGPSQAQPQTRAEFLPRVKAPESQQVHFEGPHTASSVRGLAHAGR